MSGLQAAIDNGVGLSSGEHETVNLLASNTEVFGT
jgi:hypothetical protein